jgi:Kef-type K+ transport system membrane component KefB
MLTKGQPSTRSGEPTLTVVEELAPRRSLSRKIQFLAYFGSLILFGLVIVFTLEWGQHWLQPQASAPALAVKQTVSTSSGDYSWIWAGLYRNISTPLSRLLLQFIIIIGATRTLGTIFSRIGQPAVIGEMAAGILLGPSLFGWVCPNVFGFVFSSDSLEGLRLFSQVGVCLFMFVVGMELDLGHLRQTARAAFVISQASIFLPYLLGVLMAVRLYHDHAGAGVSFITFALFMGIALSITAFPVLARILQERGIARTALGTTALACAAVDDVTAWTILAFVVAIAQATNLASTALCLALVVLFVAIMLRVVRPQLSRMLEYYYLDQRKSEPGRAVLAGTLLVMTTSALATDVIGIHALFGAFLAGVVMPTRHGFRDYLVLRIGTFSSLFLLPLFFAFSGLRTHVGLLHDMSSWLTCFGIIGIAILGKLGGTLFSARLTGMSWGDSFSLGALMNTRGLVELVALNIGYELGILSPAIFTMMVLMSLVTTFLAGPLLSLGNLITARATALTEPSSGPILKHVE